jgi:hypothetical protein
VALGYSKLFGEGFPRNRAQASWAAKNRTTNGSASAAKICDIAALVPLFNSSRCVDAGIGISRSVGRTHLDNFEVVNREVSEERPDLREISIARVGGNATVAVLFAARHKAMDRMSDPPHIEKRLLLREITRRAYF